jgi:hypothetical protein
VDGGMLALFDGEKKPLCHNFATIPALYRKCDVLILTDCNGKPNDQRNTGHLQAAFQEAREHELTLPRVSDKRFAKMDTKSDLFASDELEVPSLVYLLVQRDDTIVSGFDPDANVNELTDTRYFHYDANTYQNLRTLTRGLFAREENIENIKRAIVKAILKKKKTRGEMPKKPTNLYSAPATPAPFAEKTSANGEKSSRSGTKERKKKSRKEHDDNDNDTDDKETESNTDSKMNSSHNKKSSQQSQGQSSASRTSVATVQDDTTRDDDPDDCENGKARLRPKNAKTKNLADAVTLEKPSKTQHTNNATPAVSAPRDNKLFVAFKKVHPHYYREELENLKSSMKTFLDQEPYEAFTDFVVYAVENGSLALLKFLMNEADAKEDKPTEEQLSKIYSVELQNEIIVGSDSDLVYYPRNMPPPLYSAALLDHSRSDGDAIFDCLLEKNIHALGYRDIHHGTSLHVLLKQEKQNCVEKVIRFFETIDSMTIDNQPQHAFLLELAETIFTTKDSDGKLVADCTADQNIKKRIRRIMIKYYIPVS